MSLVEFEEVCKQERDRKGLLSWYRIRDAFFGENYVSRDIRLALELATACEHPDAVWLTRLFHGRNAFQLMPEHARDVFLEHSQDSRAVCFAALSIGWIDDEEKLRKAAENGYAFAQAKLSWRVTGGQVFRWAEKAVAQGERDGFFMMGYCFERGEGIPVDLTRAKQNYFEAAKLGHVAAMTDLALLLDEDDPQRCRWLGRAAKLGKHHKFWAEATEQMKKNKPNVLFALGRALKNNVDVDRQEMFGRSDSSFVRHFSIATTVIACYDWQLLNYRKAVNCWSVIAKRFNVVKDIRIMIAKIIWKSKKEALFEQPKKT